MTRRNDIDEYQIDLMQLFEDMKETALILYSIDRDITELRDKIDILNKRREAVVQGSNQDVITIYDQFRTVKKLKGA